MFMILDRFRGMELVPAFGQDSKMINSEEDLPKPARQLLVPLPLDHMGIDELNVYILALEAEIARVKAKIAAKDAHKTAAAAFFKKPG
jgi:uncharacterized small protein (DUF1192 family)